MIKILVLANNDVGLYKFRKELIQELLNPGSIVEGRVGEKVKIYLSLPYGNFVLEFQKMGCEFIDTPIDRRGTDPVRDFKLLRLYNKIIKNVEPDLVLTYTIKPNIYGGVISRLRKIPYISTITGLGTSIENKGLMSKAVLQMYKIGLGSAYTVFFQNKNNKQFLEKQKILRVPGKLVAGSGVNLSDHCFEDYPSKEEKLHFLFVGRIMRDKGIGEFLDCAEYIKKKYRDITFDILGDFDEEEWRERLESLHTKGNVHYYGKQDDVHSFIRSHHAIVLPSYHEGLSNILLESAACGRPVLASKIPGCQETFDDGVTGIGFEPRNSDSLIKAIETFISLPYDEKKNMGLAARKKMEKEFDRKQVVNTYMNAIEAAVNKC